MKARFAFGFAGANAWAPTRRTMSMAKSSTVTQQNTLQTHAKYERLIARAKGVESVKTLIVHPCDETSLRGAMDAAQAGLSFPFWVGRPARFLPVPRMPKL